MRPASLLRIRRAYKNLGRFREILNILLKHGLGQIIEGSQLQELAPIRWWYTPLHQRLEREEKVSLPERLKIAFEELGPTFIKLGQILSTRADLIPREYIQALDCLMDKVPPFPGEEARHIIEAELKTPMNQLVAQFDETPLAAASIAQVHRAVLWSGEEVVFKVRRPGITDVIKRDVDILYRLATLIERYVPDLAFLNATGQVEEFDQAINEEMDFIREAENAARFRANFEGSSDVYVPNVFQHLSTERVLVMEFIDGIRIDDLERLRAAGFDLEAITRQEMRADLENTIEPLVGRKLRQMPAMAYVERTMALAVKHRLRLPRELFFIAKCLAVFETVFRRLSPELDFFKLARPYARRLVTQRLFVGTLARKLRREAMDLVDVVRGLPRELHSALRKITKNDLHFKLQLTDIDPYLRRFDRASNRLTFAVIISAIILGCSIIITVASETVALQWLVVGGFVLAVLLGLWLIIAIL